MAAAPKVQTLAEAMAELNPAYAQSQQVIEKRQAGLGAKYDAQRAGITAERGEGFNTINNQATARGGSFSGVPVEEQSRYLATKYLPGLQQADYQQNEEDLTLQGQLAGISKEKRLGALSRIEQQQSALNSWNMQQQQLEAQRREAEANRAFQAQQSRIDRQFQAGQNSLRDQGPTVQQSLVTLFSDYKPHYEGGTKWQTERSIIPTLMANYNMSEKDAKELAYSYRKKTFGEGYGR